MGGISQNLNHRILDSACISWACGIDLFAVLEESPIGVGGYERSLDYGFRQSLLFSLYLLRYVRSRHFIGDLLMPIASFCGAVIFGGQFAFENGYGWFVRLICVLFWSMGFLAIVAAPGEFFSELFSDSGTTQSISSRSTRSDCSDEIDNLLRDAKMDRIQETLDDIKYWEIRNGGRK